MLRRTSRLKSNRKMPSCFVSGCRTGYRRDRGKHFFRPPREEEDFSKWDKAIPKRNIPLTRKSAICENHFSDQYFIKADSFVIDGKKVQIPRIRWSLKPGAVPNIFNNVSSTVPKPLQVQSKEITKNLMSSEAAKSSQKLSRGSHQKRRRRSSKKMENPHFIKCDPGWLPDTDNSRDCVSNVTSPSGDHVDIKFELSNVKVEEECAEPSCVLSNVKVKEEYAEIVKEEFELPVIT